MTAYAGRAGKVRLLLVSIPMLSKLSPNRLAREKSPYLLQHAHNPVDWFPWGEEAFAKARAEDKPIFLSIGYSTCHWCHVMEHESFESAAIAAFLNEHFVSIKVDREERPDVDQVYMTFVQATTGHGGWPMSVWLTPELRPFYRRHLFPAHRHAGPPRIHHRPAPHRRVVEDRTASRSRTRRIRCSPPCARPKRSRRGRGRRMGSRPKPCSSAFASTRGCSTRRRAASAARRNFRVRSTSSSCSISPAQKEPSPQDADAARGMALHTLRKMAAGGMHDHLGGGFHRYSVDAEWHVPHFEKMLYDQAQLAQVYLTAYQISGDDVFAKAARNILQYVAHDLTSPEGGFFSAEDADSLPKNDAPRERPRALSTSGRTSEIREVLGEDRRRGILRRLRRRTGGQCLRRFRSARRTRGHERPHPAAHADRGGGPFSAARWKTWSTGSTTTAPRCWPGAACVRVRISTTKSSPRGTG